MKSALISVLLLVALASPRAWSQKTYPLVCRGGGNLHFTYTPFSNLSPQPQIWIAFTRASQGVGPNRENLAVLQPGQCSWLDRAVAAAEPGTIALLNIEQFSIQWQGGQVTGISSALPFINALQDPGQYQAFDVYNNGKGYFVTTKSGSQTTAGAAQEQGVRKTIGADGLVRIYYPDGRIKTMNPSCGFTMKYPDGREEIAVCSTMVQPATAPPLPSSPENIQWLKNETDDLLDIIRGLVGNDKDAVQRYISYEGEVSEYDKIQKRTNVISKLVQP